MASLKKQRPCQHYCPPQMNNSMSARPYNNCCAPHHLIHSIQPGPAQQEGIRLVGQAGLHVRQWRLCAELSNVEDARFFQRMFGRCPSCQSRCDILRPKTSTLVFRSFWAQGWPQNVLQLDSGSLHSAEAVSFSFHVLHTFDVWRTCCTAQSHQQELLCLQEATERSVRQWNAGLGRFCDQETLMDADEEEEEDEEEVKQAVAMSIPQRNLCLMVVCCVPVVFYVPVWQVPHRGPWFGCSFSCVQLNAATALGRHASSRYIVDIVVSNRLLARSVLGFLLCFLGRRGLSCPKVINEHTYAQSLFAGGGPSGPFPRTKTWPCKGIWPPYVLDG